MAAQPIVVLGGSAGALEAISTVLGGLPGNLDASLFIVLHTAPQGGGALAQILGRATGIKVEAAVDGAPIERSRVYVAPPDHHLTLSRESMQVERGPRENGFRPAIDPLFRSAAKVFDSRAVGVILSGALDDGTFGLMALKQAGGAAIVQHPYEAFLPSMPLSAIQNVEVDYIVRSNEIAPLLIQASMTGLTKTRPETEQPATPEEAGGQRDITLDTKRPDDFVTPPSHFACPECGGTLWQLKEGNLERFRCHTGHGFTIEALLSSQNGKLEGALWSAVRVLMERAALHRQIANRTESRGMSLASTRHRDRAHAEEKNADLIRDILGGLNAAAEESEPPTIGGM
jgi:two-component system chemotaxis response regulator CheB